MDSAGGQDGGPPIPRAQRKRDSDKNKRELIAELRALRARVDELERAAQSAQPEEAEDGAPDDRLVAFPPRRERGLRDNATPEAELVNERQRAYAHLRRQLDFTRAITNSLGEGVCAVDHEGHITFSNLAVTRLLGWSGAELLGKDFHERLHVRSDGSAGGGCLLLGPLRSGETAQYDDEYLSHKDGSRLPVSCVSSPIISDNRIVGAVIAFRDTTERQQLENDLRESLRESGARALQLETIFEAITDAVVLYDAAGNVTLGNAAARQILMSDDVPNYAQLSVADRFTHVAVYDEDDVPLAQDRWPLLRILHGERLHGASSVDLRFCVTGKPDVYLNFSGAPIYDVDGNLMGAVMICRDVTERRQLERSAQETARVAAQRAAELEAIFEAITDGAVVYDASGRMVHTNATARAIMREDLDGSFNTRPFEERRALTRLRAPDGAPLDDARDPRLRVLRGEVLHSADAEDFILRNLAGDDIFLSASGSPVRGPDGEVRGGVLIFRDVTERRRLESEAAARARQMEAAFEAIADGIFVYDTSGRILYSNAADRALFDPHASGANPRRLEERRRQLTICDETAEPLKIEQWPTMRSLRGELFTGADAQDLITITADGREIHMSASGAPIHDNDGRIAGGVVVWRDVTERRQLEQRARAAALDAERRAGQIEAFYQAMPDGVIFFDRRGNIVRMNASVVQLLGLPASALDEYQALPALKRRDLLRLANIEGRLLTRDELPVIRALHGELLTGSRSVDVRMRPSSGAEVELEVSAAPVRDARGRIAGAVCVLRDVGERRRLERELVALAADRGAIFNAMSDAVFVFDADGRPRQINDAGRRMLALDAYHGVRDDLAPELAAVLQPRDEHGKELPVERRPVTRILRGEMLTEADAQDLILRALDGRDVTVTVVGAPLRDSDGHVTGAVCICRDLTERRELERRTHAALSTLLAMAEALVLPPRELAERVRASRVAGEAASLPAHSPDPISVHPIAMRLAELTRAFLESQRIAIVAVDPLTQALEPIALTGTSDALMRLRWDDLRTATLDDIFDSASQERLRRGEIVYRDVGRQPLGSLPNYGSIAMVFAPMRVDERFIGVLGLDASALPESPSAQDEALMLTLARFLALALERERLLREREEAQANEAALREANRRMDEFLSIASHELKTPVTVINLSLHLLTTFVENARRDTAPREHRKRSLLMAQKVLRRTDQQIGRLSRLVDDLLDVSRIRVDQLELHRRPSRLEDIVRRAVAEQRQLHPLRSIVLDIPDDLPAPLVVAADRIGQVVTNYLTNALKYSPEDQPVVVSVSLAAGAARVAVRDAGPGLTPSEQAGIWERFSRVKDIEVQSGSGVGLGLGLYISKTLIERQGGRVGVESAPGKGSTFWFSLPLA